MEIKRVPRSYKSESIKMGLKSDLKDVIVSVSLISSRRMLRSLHDIFGNIIFIIKRKMQRNTDRIREKNKIEHLIKKY